MVSAAPGVGEWATPNPACARRRGGAARSGAGPRQGTTKLVFHALPCHGPAFPARATPPTSPVASASPCGSRGALSRRPAGAGVWCVSMNGDDTHHTPTLAGSAGGLARAGAHPGFGQSQLLSAGHAAGGVLARVRLSGAVHAALAVVAALRLSLPRPGRARAVAAARAAPRGAGARRAGAQGPVGSLRSKVRRAAADAAAKHKLSLPLPGPSGPPARPAAWSLPRRSQPPITFA